MKRAIFAGLILSLATGCATTSPTAIIHQQCYPDYADVNGQPAHVQYPATTNLLLGRSDETVRMAAAFNYRSDWPSVAIGYRFDDLTYFTEITFDDQAFFDSLGGSYIRFGENVRSGGFLRE